jgi:hypothetical protein
MIVYFPDDLDLEETVLPHNAIGRGPRKEGQQHEAANVKGLALAVRFGPQLEPVLWKGDEDRVGCSATGEERQVDDTDEAEVVPW